MGALVIAGLSGCEQKGGSEAAFTQASQKQGAFVVVQEVAKGEYKIVDEYPSDTTRVILRSLDGKEKILSQEELDELVKEEAKKIEEGTSALTQPSMSGGGMSLGETILASAAGAIIGSWIGSKLFNNPNYQNNRKAGYKSPSTYSRSVNSFNKAKKTSTTKKSSTRKSGFFGGKSGTRSRMSFGG
jgi:hypothetical protein